MLFPVEWYLSDHSMVDQKNRHKGLSEFSKVSMLKNMQNDMD